MPDPSRIWWRARLLQRWEAESRATAPLDIMQRVEVIGGLIAAIVLLVTMWPEMRGGLFGGASQMSSGPVASWLPVFTQILAVPAGLTTLVVGGAAAPRPDGRLHGPSAPPRRLASHPGPSPR